MKTCPNCKMTTDSHSHCAVCGYEVAEIPYVESNSEKYVLNKYFWRFLFTKHIFQLVCVIIAIVSAIITLPDINWATLGAVVFSVFSLFTSIYRRLFIHLSSWKFDEDYLESTHTVMSVASGTLSIFFACISIYLKYSQILL